MFDRALTRLVQDDPKNLLLLGPRQVGKSTLLRALRPDRTINLASPTEYNDILREPERFERELRAAPRSERVILIDEVQRVPALLDAVQALSDDMPRRFRFLLSGSSARKLRRGQANLLPGRVRMRHLHPLLAAEIGSAFNLDRALAHGTLPGIYAERDAQARANDLRSYVDTYLREEIQAEALVRSIGGYARLLDLVAAASGTILNLSALCRAAGLRFETARRYVEILEDTLVVFSIPAFSGSDRSSLIAHPRLYFFDIGVRNAILRRPLDKSLPDERGLLFEHFIAQELHGRLGDLWPEAALSFFRTRSGAEVDFVIEVGREIWAIEVKASRSVDGLREAGFDALASRVRKLHRKIVVYLADRAQRFRGIEALPVERFLDSLPGS